MQFSKDFIWGTATAAAQVEGAAFEDGKQPSIWDQFSRWPGKTLWGASPETACDHYHRYKADVQLLADLKIPNYRFSVSWPRVMGYSPDSRGNAIHGTPNQKGLDFYDRLIDELLAKNITPWLTLYHWDLPLELERKGGWRNRDIRYWAAEYTDLIVKKFSDRVQNFFTINEMPCVLGGYVGWMAPGLQLQQAEVLNVAHNILLTHGTMAQAIRAAAPKAKICLAHTGFGNYPISESKEDIEAFKKSVEVYEREPGEKYGFQKGSGLFMGHCLTYWCDPIYFGRYQAGAQKAFGKDFPKILPGDMKIISTPVDFHGQNIYEGIPIRAPKTAQEKKNGFGVVDFPHGYPATHAKWPITPKSMNHFFQFIWERYKKPIFITENGISCADNLSPDKKCHDIQRIDFVRAYLEELGKAIKAGADIRGYFYWSLMDNFEWARGYGERFGLVHVDYETQKRTPKDSAYWFSDLVQTGKLK